MSTPPAIILVGTQLAVNIGMTARAMLNCGLTDLRLVSPKNGWPDVDAVAPAAGAARVIENARAFSTLDESIADCARVYATSARVRDLEIPSLGLRDAVDDLQTHLAGSPTDRSAIIFGPEASGLANDDLSRADRLVNYDLNPDYSSLNLAQAVLLFGWEWQSSQPKTTAPAGSPAAPRGDLEHFLTRLEDHLETGGFFPNPDKRPSTMQGLRAFFTRANATDRELRALQGVLTALTKKRPTDL